VSHRVNVRSVQALEDQRAALITFADTCSTSLDAAALEIRKTEEWLEERHHHWTFQVQQRQEDVLRAQRALAECQASGYRDDNGNYHAPRCNREEAALYEAQRWLRYAQEELGKVVVARRAVATAAADYMQEARHLLALLNGDVPRATALLNTKINQLHGYLSTGLASGAAGVILGGIGLAAAAIAEIVSNTRSDTAAYRLPDGSAETPIAVEDEESLARRVAQAQVQAAVREEAERGERERRTAGYAAGVDDDGRAQPPSPEAGRFSGHPAEQGGIEREPGPEAIEGALGSPERRG
jgi:hypothetical protein